MSLASNVSDLATAVATELKSHKTLINGNAADLSSLTTTSKSNLVGAINEVKASVSSAAGINDSSSSTTSTYSSSKVDSLFSSTSTSDRARANHTGTQSADTVVDGTTNKAYTATEKTKLSGIATGATANSTDAVLEARANHTGTQSADTLTDGTTNKVFTATMSTKLSGIATGATANSTDAVLEARANHTGTQVAATISDFAASVDARISNVVNGAPTALDTLKELADAIGDDANFSTTVTTALGNRLRFDAAQSLTGTQQTQGMSNLGAAAAADLAALTTAVGTTTTNFVSVFTAGLA